MFLLFLHFGKSISFSPQKTHSIRATVPVDDLRVALLCSSFWEPLSLERLFFMQYLRKHVCDTLLVFQSIKVQEIQRSGCILSNVEEYWRLIIAKRSYKYSKIDFNPSGELYKLSDNPYKRVKSPILFHLE